MIRDKDRCMVCGRPYAEHTPEERASGCKRQPRAAGVAFFYKRQGGRTHAAGGRLLDGRTWDEFPEPAREPASA